MYTAFYSFVVYPGVVVVTVTVIAIITLDYLPLGSGTIGHGLNRRTSSSDALNITRCPF